MINKHSVVWDNAYEWLEAFNKSTGAMGENWEPLYTPPYPVSEDNTEESARMEPGEYCESILCHGCDTGDDESRTYSFDVAGEDNAIVICNLYNYAPAHVEELLKYADELAAQLHVAQTKLAQAEIRCPVCGASYNRLDYVHCPACYARAMAANRET